MYKRRTQGSKRDPVKQWALPDRVFFAAGACHILAYAFLEAYPDSAFRPVWIRPATGHTGNHIVVVRSEVVFDYHGYSNWSAYWAHTKRRANQWGAGWDADIVAVHQDALVSNAQAREHDGLRMKEPKDYLFDRFHARGDICRNSPRRPGSRDGNACMVVAAPEDRGDIWTIVSRSASPP